MVLKCLGTIFLGISPQNNMKFPICGKNFFLYFCSVKQIFNQLNIN